MESQYDYDTWGKVTRLGDATNGTESDFRYTGHYYHACSSLHLAMYRAYDAGLGRWISRDPIAEGDGPNVYTYARNNPIKYLDYLGLESESTSNTIQVEQTDNGQTIRRNTHNGQFASKDDYAKQLARDPLPKVNEPCPTKIKGKTWWQALLGFIGIVDTVAVDMPSTGPMDTLTGLADDRLGAGAVAITRRSSDLINLINAQDSGSLSESAQASEQLFQTQSDIGTYARDTQ